MKRFFKHSQNPPDETIGQSLMARFRDRVDDSIEKYVWRDYSDRHLVFVPGDLVTCDPSFIDEISRGQFGLDSMFVEFDREAGQCVFDAPYRDDGFDRALHGFSWLRDLASADQIIAQEEAQHLVFEWISRFDKVSGTAYEPLVVARRIVSFLSNAPLINEGQDQDHQRQFLHAICGQVDILTDLVNEVEEDLPRLFCLVALALAALCISRNEYLLEQVTPALGEELERQILPDGGHISRNPGVLLDLLFDLIPLKEAYEKRLGEVPDALNEAIARMLPMIRFFRMGDSSLARFNGQSATPTDALATLLAHDERKRKKPLYAEQTGYCRMEDSPALVLCDVGAAPTGPAALTAHAGCLSFELSVRHFALVVNAGAFTGEDEEWRRYARSTAAHSTLTLDGLSQASFTDDGALSGPVGVFVEHESPSAIRARHNGYRESCGLTHRRTLLLEYDGLRLSGIDRLEGFPLRPNMRYQIRFHLHPFVDIAPSDGESIYLALPDGEVWRFKAQQGDVQLVDSIYLAYRRGLEPAHQILLTGDAHDGAEVNWLFEQIKDRPPVI
jgi:uncharacterized heparinase superfamily protein